MKGRALILIFLFLFLFQTVCAESHTGEVDLQLSLDASDWSLLDAHSTGTGSISIWEMHYKGVADAGIPDTLVFRDAEINKGAAYSWSNIPQNVGGSFALYDNGVFAGSGGITIHRVNDVDVSRVDIWYQFDDTDFVINTSETTMDVTLYASPINEYYSQFILDYGGNPYSTQNIYMELKAGASYWGTHASWSAGGSSYVEYDYYGHFINEYNITLTGSIASTKITRDGLGQDLSSSRLKLTNSTGSTVYLPSSYCTTNTTRNHDNGSYYYYLDVENYGDVLIYDAIGSGAGHSAIVEFNQTFYTDPEHIEMEWEIIGYDSENYNYKILMIATLDGDVSGNFWEANGEWNISHYITSSFGTALYDLNGNWYDLPVWVQGEIWSQDLITGTWTKMDNTPAVIYHESGYTPAKIEFNQSSYISPERVGIIYNITGPDFDNEEYWITVMGSQDGFSNWQYVDYDYDPSINNSNGTRSVAIYQNTFQKPFHIKAILYSYNYNSGDTRDLDVSGIVVYSDIGGGGIRGKIWTEKNTYNISEIFYIEFETDYSTVEIELISDTFHDIRTMEGNGHGHLGYAFITPHNFTAYLYEGGEVTNQTSFSVVATSPFLNIFLDLEALKSQFALEYYTDNTSDTITGYKPDGSIFYGPITNLQTNKRTIITGISSSSPPGIYTISLFHDSTTYYNDTIELYSTNEWVYFEASKYETGDRIKIYSYVTDSRQQVRLTDSIGTAVITWTDSAGYIIPNRQTILYFSLIDNNEYGMNVNTSIDAGTFRTGNWKVEIIGIDGKPLTNESTYDYTTVSKRIESPADTSDEMIDIFFSPEGAFMLFTVCLTMMGLAVAKHPAGGGAGATVGTGFGVYFNVLPLWMLMLAVITLVVLAGVSIAVYFKGK